MTTQTQTKAKASAMPKTTQTQKAAPKGATKQAVKPVQKTTTKAKPKAYAALLIAILEGKITAAAQRYYVRALEYHQKQGTAFPRAQCASAELPKADDVKAFLSEGKVYAPASKAGQRAFDEMVAQMFGAKIPVSK